MLDAEQNDLSDCETVPMCSLSGLFLAERGFETPVSSPIPLGSEGVPGNQVYGYPPHSMRVLSVDGAGNTLPKTQLKEVLGSAL